MGSRLKKIRRAAAANPAAPIALTDEVRWKEDLLCLNHLLGTMGFPKSMRQPMLFKDEEPGKFVPGVTLATPDGRSVDLTLYPVPGEREAALQVWKDWLRSVPVDAAGKFEEEFFSRIFFDSMVAHADFVEALVHDIEAARIEIPKLREHERLGLSPVPTA